MGADIVWSLTMAHTVGACSARGFQISTHHNDIKGIIKVLFNGSGSSFLPIIGPTWLMDGCGGSVLMVIVAESSDRLPKPNVWGFVQELDYFSNWAIKQAFRLLGPHLIHMTWRLFQS